ncbi:PqqD family protein [Salinigranum rubrum]|uniref:PqqD family protein n=1 Tax=Salinigranum rubrum TaxID=755307 RepID=A0A2I8VKN0_9EURY|nr:PqqD family protein [Salinigranum rubrum]AUV81639.1 PqqD family protein [Salinigranum rubrum]
MTALDADTTVVATSDSVSADVGGERVLLNVAAGTYHGMNAVGSRVFDLVDEPRPVRAVVESVREEFDVDAATADDDVRAFLSELVEAGLVAVVDPA